MSHSVPEKTSSTRSVKILLAAAGLAIISGGVGLRIGYTMAKNKLPSKLEPVIQRGADQGHPLIKPLVGIDFPSQSIFSELEPLKTAAANYISDAKASGKAKRVSFYFRDALSAHWVGVGEDDLYHPASLFKLPYLIALYKNAEVDPQLLNESVYFSGSSHNSADQVQHLQGGRSYTVEELAAAMIKQSDNDAKDLLLTKIQPQFLMEALTDLGVWPQDISTAISPRVYTAFFRVLFSATFLNNEMSERALELLSQADFKEGLNAGTPSTIKVAHKFGEYADTEEGQVTAVELHDCGIVYYPQHPYFLCVMTEGYNRSDLANVIKGVANVVYTEFNKLHLSSN